MLFVGYTLSHDFCFPERIGLDWFAEHSIFGLL